jgi:thioredoxin-dependent peroxiredoxin
VESHAKFRAKERIPHRLLADTTHEVSEAYGVWRLKSFMGKKYMGIVRTTFIIGPDGRIARVFEGVDPKEHGSEIADAIQELTG